jgi:hypothetical protein
MFGYALQTTSLVRVGRSETMFPNELRQVWNSIESGRLVAIPMEEDGGSNQVTTRGLLPWKTRGEVYVLGPTVFLQMKWVSRRLTK